MDRQPGLVLDVFIGCLVPFFVGMAELRIVADLVLLADVGDPAVEGVERRAVAQESRFAERAVEVDLDRGAAFVFRRLVGIFDTVVVCRLYLSLCLFAFTVYSFLHLPSADPVVFGKGGVQGDR